MKTDFRILVAMLLAVVIGVCSSCTSLIGDTIKPSKTYVTRDYKVKKFSQIDANTVGDIYYTQSSDGTTSVQIYGPDNIVDLIQVAVKNGTLLLDMKNNKVRNIKKMKITICTPVLTALNFKGVGNVLIEKGLKTDTLKIDNKGVGDIMIFQLQCDRLEVDSKGVGNVKIEGKARQVSLDSKGVGNIEAENLEAEEVSVFSKGVGDISCNATQSLDASAKGVGNIKYKGNPANKNLSKGGIGTIKNI